MIKEKRIIILFLLALATMIHVYSIFAQNAQLNIQNIFIPSGYMGDGEYSGGNYIKFDGAYRHHPHSEPDCIKIEYKFGPQKWGGIYWQNRADNWGKFPPKNLSNSNFTKVVFWARGEKGNEKVEFKSGGIYDQKFDFYDSYSVSIGRIDLSTEWKKYEINLTGEDLSSVIGGFCWVSSQDYNSDKKIIFYIDDIHFE